jgi:Ca-activated chloride channel family protein
MPRHGCRAPHGRLAAAAVVALAGLCAPPAGAQALERRLYVSVVDGTGAPVTDLTAADFTVREDGVLREVLRVTRAVEPMQVAVLVDDTEAATPAIADLRRGLQAFVAALAPEHQVALVTFGERPTILVDFTTDPAKLRAGVGRLFAKPGTGSYLLEAILETARGFAAREARRPVLVVVTTEGVEFSNDYYATVLEAVRRSGAQMHALVRTTGEGAAPEEGARNRSVVLADGPEQTGGGRHHLLADSSIPLALDRLAAELKAQYALVYARPQTLIPPERLEVTVRRPGLTVRAPRLARP